MDRKTQPVVGMVTNSDLTDTGRPVQQNQYLPLTGITSASAADIPVSSVPPPESAHAKTFPISPLGGLSAMALTPQESQNNLFFIASAMDYMDRLFKTLNQHSVLVQNLQHMFPKLPVTDQSPENSAIFMDSDQPSPCSSLSSIDIHGDITMEADTNGSLSNKSVDGQLTQSSDNQSRHQSTSRHKHSSLLNGETQRLLSMNGAVSKKQRYQRTHDVLRKSGLLRIAKKTAELKKESAKMDQQISKFKAVVNQHIVDVFKTVENSKMQQAVQLLKANCAAVNQEHLGDMGEAQGARRDGKVGLDIGVQDGAIGQSVGAQDGAVGQNLGVQDTRMGQTVGSGV